MVTYWRVPRLWEGDTAYIVGGGPSVTPDMIESLRGRKVVAVNMSYLSAPFASYLFFADLQWWERESKERPKELFGFKGTIVSTNEHINSDRLKVVRRIVPVSDATGIAEATDTVSMERTSLQGAMNLCYHLGAKRLVLLGADNRDAPNGRIHHHDEYPWVRYTESWDIKGRQFGYAAAALKRLGVRVTNCSMVSTLNFWPKMHLADVLQEEANESH